MRHKPDVLIASRGRRRFLIGTAGATLALPFLESLARPQSAGAWAPAPGMPRRLAIFFHEHGSIMEHFVPGNGFRLGSILQPVADAGLQEKMLVVTGVDSKVQEGHEGAPSLLTCTPLVANQHNVTFATSASIDHVIARHMQDGGSPRRLDLGVSDDSTRDEGGGRRLGFTFWAGDNEKVEAIIRPQLAFDTVLPDGTTPTGPTGPTTDLSALRRRSVLDATLRQFSRLQGRVSASDRLRLDAHAERLRDIERSIQTTVQPPTPPPASCGDDPGIGPVTGLTHGRAAEVQADILAHAIACNQADVGTFNFFDMQEPSWGHVNHPDLAGTFAGEDYHGAWHRAADGEIDSARRTFTAINAWFGSVFARFLSRLDSYDEDGGTALDNTLVLWVSDFGHGGGHSSGNLPIVIAGNAGGPTLGRHVNYATDPTSPWRADSNPGNHNLAVTLMNAFGMEGERFGNYSEVEAPVNPGPLSL